MPDFLMLSEQDFGGARKFLTDISRAGAVAPALTRVRAYESAIRILRPQAHAAMRDFRPGVPQATVVLRMEFGEAICVFLTTDVAFVLH